MIHFSENRTTCRHRMCKNYFERDDVNLCDENDVNCKLSCDNCRTNDNNRKYINCIEYWLKILTDLLSFENNEEMISMMLLKYFLRGNIRSVASDDYLHNENLGCLVAINDVCLDLIITQMVLDKMIIINNASVEHANIYDYLYTRNKRYNVKISDFGKSLLMLPHAKKMSNFG